MLFTIGEHQYKAPDKIGHGVLIKYRELTRREFRKDHPETVGTNRDQWFQVFAMWSLDFTDGLKDHVFTLQSFLTPVNGAPPVTEEWLMEAPSEDVEKVLDFFTGSVAVSNPNVPALPMNGKPSKTRKKQAENSGNTSLPNTKSE